MTGNNEDKRNREDPILSGSREEREAAWDELYLEEEGIVAEFDSGSNTGKIRSLKDATIYSIDSRELIRTRIELRPGDKVIFAPIESPDGDDYARVLRIVELNC